MRVLIFPNDPLAAYLKKGELKDRYFNPNNIFDEVHKEMIGGAKMGRQLIMRLSASL